MALSPMPKVMILRDQICPSPRARRKSRPPWSSMALSSLGGPGRIITAPPSSVRKPQPGAVPQVL